MIAGGGGALRPIKMSLNPPKNNDDINFILNSAEDKQNHLISVDESGIASQQARASGTGLSLPISNYALRSSHGIDSFNSLINLFPLVVNKRSPPGILDQVSSKGAGGAACGPLTRPPSAIGGSGSNTRKVWNARVPLGRMAAVMGS